jgi:hypothetical protein
VGTVSKPSCDVLHRHPCGAMRRGRVLDMAASWFESKRKMRLFTRAGNRLLQCRRKVLIIKLHLARIRFAVAGMVIFFKAI